MMVVTMTLVPFVFSWLMAFMLAVTAVHEQMHERAQQEYRIGQHAQNVSRVFGDEIETGDGEESKGYKPDF